MRQKGSMTVTMSLILMVLLSLLAACIQSLRTACARVQAVSSMDAGLYSLFSEFDRDLLEDYNLFFLDAGYGSENINVGRIIDRTEYFVKPIAETGLTTSILQICAVDGYRLASDRRGEAVRQQIIRYMKGNLGNAGLELLREQFLENKEEMSEQGRVQNAGIREHDITDVSPMDGISEHNNPLEIIRNIQRNGILGLVVPSGEEVSQNTVNTGEVLSQRTLQTGMGEFPSSEGYSLTDKLLMQEYILEKFSFFTEEKRPGNLSYQAEYIIGGKKSDRENLKYVVNRLLFLRETANIAFLYTDSEKRAELEACASALSLLLLIPEGMALVQTVLAAGWAYVESVLDVKTLLAGGKVPLVKDKASWKTQLNHLSLENTRSDERGMDYRSYLGILLSFSSEDTLTVRCMDMIEQNIRSKINRESFALDACLDWISMSYQFTGPGGKIWKADRTYTYDM